MPGFFAYPSRSEPLLGTIRAALNSRVVQESPLDIMSWEENDIAGRFVHEPVLSNIASSEIFIADVTFYNFNVYYEIGFAIGCGKRPVLVKNSALVGDGRGTDRVSLLDTLGYQEYRNADELVTIIAQAKVGPASLLKSTVIDHDQPVYFLRTPKPVDFDMRVLSRLKKVRLGFRMYDPEEAGPLAAGDAIDQVSKSIGVVIHLLPTAFAQSESHNLCMSFVAGLAHGLGRHALIMQTGADPVPLDYRHFVTQWKQIDQIETIIGDFAPEIYAQSRSTKPPAKQVPPTGLGKIQLGATAAENEFSELSNYFIPTDEYRRILRGEVHLCAGRKGSGKTALFSQARDYLRRNKKNIVLDLQPEGSQLLKIKDLLLEMLSKGTKEHTIVAFWEYLLLLEICHKVLHKDHQLYTINHELYDPYLRLSKAYGSPDLVREGDFAERMIALVETIQDSFDLDIRARVSTSTEPDAEITLSRNEITQLLYKHNIRELRTSLVEYLKFKDEVWILFDNLDKGWSAYGVDDDDILLLRCLQDALTKIRNELSRDGIVCRSTVFLRNDILSLLVDQTPDRGKLSIVSIDWNDPELLRELVRRRVIYSLGVDKNMSFGDVWPQIAVTHYKTEESAQYLIDRSLMRPRALIDLLQKCLSHALNMSHPRIEPDDIDYGEHAFSSHLVEQIGFEIRDVLADADSILYAFIGSRSMLSREQILASISESGTRTDPDKMLEILLWYGVIGVVHPDTSDVVYIHNVMYEMKRLRAIETKAKLSGLFYAFNPSFKRGLDIVN